MDLNRSMTWEMVLRGKPTKQLPNTLPSIGRTPEHILTYRYIKLVPGYIIYYIRACKLYGYAPEDLTVLFNILIMSLLLYDIEDRGSGLEGKHLLRIYQFTLTSTTKAEVATGLLV